MALDLNASITKNTLKNGYLKKSVVFFFITSLIYLFSLNVGMFWDNVLFAGKMGTYLYNTGLFSLRMPVEFDPGHPPFLAFINALGWKLMGRHLWVSHLVLTPFIFGFLWQINRFIQYFIKEKLLQYAALLLILADPTLCSHFVLVNPQIIQLFFFFLAVNGILYKKNAHQILGLAMLGIVTFRGMMICAGIFLFEFFNEIFVNRIGVKNFFSRKRLLIYFFGAIPAIAYVTWRLVFIGWLQTHPDSAWSELWQFVDIKTFLRNLLVLINRFFDFGRITIFLFILGVFFYNKKYLRKQQTKTLVLLGSLSVIIIALVSVLAVNPMGHRYYIASYLVFILLAFVLLQNIISRKWKRTWYFILLSSLITGNLWIYPEGISQGWDSSLAHMPYFKLREKAIDYMKHNNIDISSTASFFPNLAPTDYVDLKGGKESFQSFSPESDYVFYSNVYNLSDKELENLKTAFIPLQEFKRHRIRIIIYQKKTSVKNQLPINAKPSVN